MDITRRDFSRSAVIGTLALAGTIGCQTNPAKYNIANLNEEQRIAYDAYLAIDPKNLTKRQERMLEEYSSEENQNDLTKEINGFTKEDLEREKSFLADYPWIRQDIWEYGNDSKEILRKVNSLNKKDLVFYLEALSGHALKSFPAN